MRHFFLLNPQLALEIFAASSFGTFMLIEIFYNQVSKKNLIDWRDFATNWEMYVGYFLINLFWVPCILLIYTFFHKFAPFHLGYNWWTFLIFAEDLCFYTFHRSSHKFHILWASHVNHHSSKQFNLSVALRQTWTPFTAVIFWIPLALIGFDPLLILTTQFFSLFYQSFLHTQMIKSLGPLEWIFNTPKHHRIHHGTNHDYLNKNFGGVFIIWDRLFGTFQRETEPPIYGLSENIETYNPFIIAFHEWGSLLKGLIAK